MALIMNSGFICIIMLGHIYSSLLCLYIAIKMFSEIMNVNENEEKANRSLIKYVEYMYLITALFIECPYLFINKQLISDILEEFPILEMILFKYHMFISVMLLMVLLMGFVVNLSKYGSFLY